LLFLIFTISSATFINWYVELDLLCVDKLKVNFVVTWFYIGYFFGISLFFMPDQFGRRITILFSQFIAVLGYAMIIFIPNLIAKSIGFFIIGFVHIKNSIAYTQCSEFLPLKNQEMAITLISLYDTANITLCCVYVMFFDIKINDYVLINFCFAALALILYFFIVPESPKFLLMNDPTSEKGIDIINYISRFNGKKYQITKGSIMDIEQ